MNILFVLLAATVTRALPTGASARRAPDVHFHAYLEAARQTNHRGRLRSPFGKLSRAVAATDAAVAFAGGGATRPAPAWENEAELLERFRLMRDARPLFAADRPMFPRRATWLYPDDGCYARAGLAVRTLRDLEPAAPAPGKVFLFGDLGVATGNSPAGRVEWWYHVAPIVRVGDVNYVLDPAIEPSRPLTVDEWVGRQTTSPASTLIAVCGTGAYVPSDRCDTGGPGEGSSVEDERELLAPEWERLEELGRVPQMELGDNPPWA